MGVYINLNISYAVTKEEWEMLYEEVVELAKKLPFAVVEENEIYLLPKEEQENYVLYRDLIQQKKYNKYAGDAMWSALPYFTDFEQKDPRCNRCYEIWGPKIPRKTYHLHLLEIACLIEARLGEKAFVFGNITGEQCERAVGLVYKHTKNRISLPARCDKNRFYERVMKMKLSELERIFVFESMYWGKKDYQFGAYLRQMFSKELCHAYWEKRFRDCAVNTVRFQKYVNEYLSWGFEWDMLCKIVNQEKTR